MEQTIIDMVINPAFQFFGEFTFYLNIVESKNISTCGVALRKDGCLVLLFNKEFIDRLSKNEITFLLIHEVFHLLWDHIKRSVGYDQNLANLAQDMIINQCIYDDIICKEMQTNIQMPQDEHGRNSGVYVPKEYNGELIFEDLYSWLKKDYEQWQKNKKANNKNKGDDEGDGGSDDEIDNDNSDENSSLNKPYGPFGKSIGGNKNPEMYSKESFYENLEQSKGMTMDVHSLDELPEEIKKDLVEQIINTCRNRGVISASVEQLLGKLQKSEHDYLKEIKRSINHSIFGTHKEKSIRRLNRRGVWGLKGKQKYTHTINVILDTSGSMGSDFEFVLSYIFQNGISINLLLIDTEIKAFYKIKKKEQLCDLKVKGLGGTELTPALKMISSDKILNGYNTVILTDGYTDTLDFKNIKGKTLIISIGIECRYKNNDKDVNQILIQKK